MLGAAATGIGVGLTLPTLMAAAASSLPPTAFATGSAVVNMLRQVGFAIGVAVLIAVLGSPRSPASVLAAYQRGWTVTAAVALAGGIITDFLRPHRGGRLAVVATPLQQGRTQQLWQVEIRRPEDQKLVARGQVRLQNIEADA